MSEYFSTQESVTARASALRLKGWTDFDGDKDPDPETLEAGFRAARGEIRDMLKPRYGDTVIAAWDSDNVPDSIRSISDDISIWFYTTTNPHLAKVTRILYMDAIRRLKEIANGKREIYEETRPEEETTTARMTHLPYTADDYTYGVCHVRDYEDL